MRKDRSKRHARFIAIIEKTIALGCPKETRDFEGFKWAAISQSEWSKRMAVTGRTLRELAKFPPVVATRTITSESKPIVLYRTGLEAHKSPRHLASIMAKIFCQKYGREKVSREEWGCLYGLAEVWPDGFQTAIFKTVLSDLKAFIVGVREADPESEFYERYYHFLPIKLLRKYAEVAVTLHIIEVQASGAAPVEWLQNPMSLFNQFTKAKLIAPKPPSKEKGFETSSPQSPPLLQQVSS